MSNTIFPKIAFILLAVMYLSLCGCQPASEAGDGAKLTESVGPDTTIRSLGEIYRPSPIQVKGFGIVAGLAGTGSSECPPLLRDALVKYILQQVSDKSKIYPEKFINSKDTAVVEIYGTIPPLASKGQPFNLTISAIAGSQTVSLDGGRLFTAELKSASELAVAEAMMSAPHLKTLAVAHGAVFIDKLGTISSDAREARILGGGIAMNDPQISLVMFEADYIMANAIRNRINERFGPGTASAVLPNEIHLNIPAKFRYDKERFLAMVESLSMNTEARATKKRIERLTAALVAGPNREVNEVALAAIGKAAIGKLRKLAGSDDEAVRFHSARCLLQAGDDGAVEILAAIARDQFSGRRIEAIKTIGANARRNDAVGVLTGLLPDEDFSVRHASYTQLSMLEDISIKQRLIGTDFFVENVVCSGPKVIYASQRDIGRIVLFGAPIECEKNIFIESPDKQITINSPAGQDYITVMRTHPTQPRLVGPLRCGFDLTDVIQTICGYSREGISKSRPGLGVPYSDLLPLLRQMCQQGAIKADFRAGEPYSN
jgi:flagellar basal body P-ring protein FlgI